MYKKIIVERCHFLDNRSDLILKMKLIVFLLLVSLTSFSANIYSQKTLVTINNEEIKEKPEFSNNQVQQSKGNKITGKVTDESGAPLPGVTITVLGSTKGVITDSEGKFEIYEIEPTNKLVFSFIGMETQVIDVGNNKNLNIVLVEKTTALKDVTVVAFGKQKKESMVSSIETIKTDELRVPSSNLTTALSGRMAGLISYQTSGEPGEDNATFFIRGVTSFGTGKVNPLILIDNVEVTTDDLSRLHPDDVQSFSILKDATATALYGARGANGVILVTTKEGAEGAAKVSVRFENSFSSPTKEVETADPITYMRLNNEAVRTRDPLAGVPYSEEKIEYTTAGKNQYVYPAVDWMDMMFKNVTMNQRANINISGGGKVARYYIAGGYSKDNGILKIDKRGDSDSNIDLSKYMVSSNININLTKSTEAIVRIRSTYDNYEGPLDGGSTLYTEALNTSPVRFPATFAADSTYSLVDHTLFGNTASGNYLNPYAQMVRGHKEKRTTVLLTQFELKQDLDMITDGLKARLLCNTTRRSYFDLSRSFNPFYYSIANYDRTIDEYTLMEINPEDGTDYLSYNEGSKTVSSSLYAEGSLSYNKKMEKNSLSGMLVVISRSSLDGNAGTLSESLPERNLGLSGRFTYSYDNRFMSEFNFGYNGSEKFDESHRWGFFPSFGLGWNLSNESWWKGSLMDDISKLKIKVTYGMVGNDAIGSTRFFYLSNIVMGAGAGYTFGSDFSGESGNGITISNYANPEIGWEKAYKTNLGVELGLFEDKINIQADFFHERRTNILQSRASIPPSMGLWSTPQANIGEATNKGVDCSIDYNNNFNKHLWLTARANFTYARGLYKKYEEPDYTGTPWLSKIGRPITQKWGYIAERLFIDQVDIDSSPRQDLGEYSPGDIKYRDLNGDDVINTLDVAPIGQPTTPEINYGFGVSLGYDSFDFSFFVQGSAKSSFWISPSDMTPFRQYTTDASGGKTLERGLAQFIADDYWSEETQNPAAAWPRLSNYNIDNNNVTSTYYMKNGSYMRLKSVEIGYSLPKSLVGRAHMSSARLYVNGTNLLLLSNFDTWDIEMGGNGLGYPLQRVINLGVNLTF